MGERYVSFHDHKSENCICWVMGAYAVATCDGTCHLPQRHAFEPWEGEVGDPPTCEECGEPAEDPIHRQERSSVCSDEWNS